MAIDYEQAKVLLNNSYEKAAQELPAAVTQYITDNKDALDTIFFLKNTVLPRGPAGLRSSKVSGQELQYPAPLCQTGRGRF